LETQRKFESSIHLLEENLQYALNVIFPQQVFERWAMVVWVGGGCLGVRHPIRDPLVNGRGDTMLRAIRDLVSIGHLFDTNVDEWVEVVGSLVGWTSEGHFRLQVC
jgi:hypothetical protein